MSLTLNNSFGQDRFLKIFKWHFKKFYFKLYYAVSTFPNISIFVNNCIIYQNMNLNCSLFNTYTRTDTHLDVYHTATNSVLSVQGNI